MREGEKVCTCLNGKIYDQKMSGIGILEYDQFSNQDKSFQKEIALYTKRKDAEVKKILDEEKRIQIDLQKRMREMKKEGEQTSAGMQNLKSVLKFKRYQGVEKVKEEKKKLEAMLQVDFYSKKGIGIV